MSDLVADGQPFETPLSAAAEAYAATPPSLGETLGSMAMETTGALARAAERGQYAGSSLVDRLLYGIDPEYGAIPGAPLPGSIQTPTLSADEANRRFAPVGPDGKPVRITDEPITEGVARLIGKAKADELERERVISRWQGAHGFVANFFTGAAGFLLDPLNAASLFVPGFGEEAVLAGLGRAGITASGIAGRTVARAAAGAVSGATSQAPITALRYGLGTEEGSDYDLRAAFRDMLFAGAAGAALHAGFGAAREAGILAPDKLMEARWATAGVTPTTAPAAEAPAPAETAIAGSSAGTTEPAPVRQDAMRAAVAQLADGRPVDVTPIVSEQAPPSLGAPASRLERNAQRARQLQLLPSDQLELWRDGFVPSMPGEELRAAAGEIYDAGAAPPPGAAAAPSGEPAAGEPARDVGEGHRAARPGEPAGLETPQPGLFDVDRQIAMLEQRLANQQLDQETAAELADAAAAVDRSRQLQQAYQQAGECLTEALA